MTNKIAMLEHPIYTHFRVFSAIVDEGDVLAKNAEDVVAELESTITGTVDYEACDIQLHKGTLTPTRSSWIMRKLFKTSSASVTMFLVAVKFILRENSSWNDVQPQIIDVFQTVLGWDDVEVVDFDEWAMVR